MGCKKDCNTHLENDCDRYFFELLTETRSHPNKIDGASLMRLLVKRHPA
ncbi:hypothetical protein [Nostoc sp.]